ncbi:hypothetical protein HMPREF3159_03460 [Brachybacterium sp. HMSC06H03]|uniref:hypothetical protein n=1 Tax=Brachybacterium sp. HMSC06H03 TaxID=1581127 RepID=UPI0008A2F08A|nr:hypothetical protein [Brachybacterium sp. HMSC06H03]OFT62582.1 hypothetical protein HMPREF3159_03460 [Brachybacterium sp. HMSC06H03]
MTQTINRTQFRNAAIAACRVAYKAVLGGDFDTDCLAKEQWIREEQDALEPALEALGISVEPLPALPKARANGVDVDEVRRIVDQMIAVQKEVSKRIR